MKKLLSVLFLLLCLCQGAASADEAADGIISGDYEYILLEDGKAEITKYRGKDEDISIPAELDGVRVSSIGDYAFNLCRITGVTIPDSITGIGANPFFRCLKLTDIRVSIDHPTMAVIDGVLFEKTEKRLVCYPCAFDAESYAIPQGIRIIGSESFAGNNCLREIVIPDSVTSIGGWAFCMCPLLREITIPEGAVSIGEYAFSGCVSLARVAIPDSVDFIGNHAFEYCNSMTDITIPEGITSIEYGTFSGSGLLAEIVIPEGVVSIGEYAFFECSGLTGVTIPNSVASIGKDAFARCDALVLTVGRDSCAKQYAVDNGIEYTYADLYDWLNG